MPKGDIFGMFLGRVCLSLMERTTTTLACLQVDHSYHWWQDQSVHRWKNKKNISSGEEENNMQRSKLRRDIVLRCADEIPYIKAHRRIKGKLR
jgi:hypothetical protein